MIINPIILGEQARLIAMTNIKKTQNDMIWNVYKYNINSNEIEIFNVFNHARFMTSVKKLLEECNNKESFEQKMKSIAMYNFWSKCEYEVIVTSWPPYISKKELDEIVELQEKCKYRTSVNLETGIKIDIYQQLELNWNSFINYTWSFK